MKKLLLIFLTALCVGCGILAPSTYTYEYTCVVAGDTATMYEDMLYYAGDTVVLIPSMKEIIIVDIKFYNHDTKTIQRAH
jgi:hypothetical protein